MISKYWPISTYGNHWPNTRWEAYRLRETSLKGNVENGGQIILIIFLMEALQIKIDNQDILRDGVSGIYYTQKSWRQLSVSDNASDRQWWHGRTVSPTFARVRIITLEGYIDRKTNPATELDVVKFMENLFPLQADPSILSPRVLYVKDVYNREWALDVKVKEPLDIFEGDSGFKGSHWTWRVVLESVGDPTYFSPGELLETGIEGIYGGTPLGVAFPFAMSSMLNAIEVINIGNSASYPRIEITVNAGHTLTSPLMIGNMTDGTTFSLLVDWVEWDLIVIDSENMKCYKNDLDITSLRSVGSIWPKVVWTTNFIINDNWGGVVDSDFSVNIYYKNSLL